MINIDYDVSFKDDTKFNLIFLSGWGQDKNALKPLGKLFESKFSLYFLSLSGFGNSKLKHSYFLVDYLLEIEEFISLNKLDNIALIGYSFGGKLALFLKQRHPEYYVITIAPSIVKNPFSLKVFLKIKLYKISKKLKLPIKRMFKGSKDYQNSKGYLKSTFMNVVHAYMTYEDIAKLEEFMLIAFESDEEVKIKSIKKIKKYNNKVLYYKFFGNHYSYLDNLLPIYQIIYLYLRTKI